MFSNQNKIKSIIIMIAALEQANLSHSAKQCYSRLIDFAHRLGYNLLLLPHFFPIASLMQCISLEACRLRPFPTFGVYHSLSLIRRQCLIALALKLLSTVLFLLSFREWLHLTCLQYVPSIYHLQKPMKKPPHFSTR